MIESNKSNPLFVGMNMYVTQIFKHRYKLNKLYTKQSISSSIKKQQEQKNRNQRTKSAKIRELGNVQFSRGGGGTPDFINNRQKLNQAIYFGS